MSHLAAIVQLVSTALRPFSTNMQLQEGVVVLMYQFSVVRTVILISMVQKTNVSIAVKIRGIAVFITHVFNGLRPIAMTTIHTVAGLGNWAGMECVGAIQKT